MFKSKLLLIILVAFVALGVNNSFAQEAESSLSSESSSGEVSPTEKRVSDIKGERIDQIRQKFETQREAVRDKVDAIREGVRGDISDKMERAREEREQKTLELKQMFEERKQEIIQKREEVRERLEKHLSEKLVVSFERLIDRFISSAERLANLAGAIEERIAKFEEQGKDMTTPLQNLEIAKGKIAELDAVIKEVETFIGSSLETNELEAGREKIRVETEKIKASLREAHEALVETVKSIKASYGVSGEEQNDDTNTESEETEEENTDTDGDNNDGE